MTVAELEETHYPVEETLFSPDGLSENIIEVCAHCNPKDDLYAVQWPCPLIEEAENQ